MKIILRNTNSIFDQKKIYLENLNLAIISFISRWRQDEQQIQFLTKKNYWNS